MLILVCDCGSRWAQERGRWEEELEDWHGEKEVGHHHPQQDGITASFNLFPVLQTPQDFVLI
jgi:hypothetical protein